MRKIISLALYLAIIIIGCKKNNGNLPGCDATVAGIAGTYKLTKIVAAGSGVNTDITNTIDACELKAIYQLKADKTAIYNEPGSCSNSTVGTWDVVENRITVTAGKFNFSDSHIDNNCNSIAITQGLGGIMYITAFTRQ
jgi:Lipocalin-like domain